MSKIRSCVFPVAVRTGLLVVSFLTFSNMTAVNVIAQEAPPQTEEQKQAREALNKGAQSFKNGQYDEAIAGFQRAKQLDPQLLNARLYLATAFASQYIPGAPSEQNTRLGRQAIDEFKDVLTIDPQNISAIDGVGSILFQMAGTPYDAEKFQESKSYHQKHLELRPNDPEPYYWIGVIDWVLSFRANGELRAIYNQHASGRKQVRDTDPLPTELRQEYLREFGATIDEGIESLKRAIESRPDYDDAMAYLNLLYRRKADTVDYQNERDALLRMADDLIDRVKNIKMKRAEQPSQP
jgi:tetratricopeptide (TPR) repeat protein